MPISFLVQEFYPILYVRDSETCSEPIQTSEIELFCESS